MIDNTLIERLQSLEATYCWSIGAGIIANFECSIWERAKWRDRGRVVINAHGKSFDEAIARALEKLAIRQS